MAHCECVGVGFKSHLLPQRAAEYMEDNKPTLDDLYDDDGMTDEKLFDIIDNDKIDELVEWIDSIGAAEIRWHRGREN